jgi:hypothetical protein
MWRSSPPFLLLPGAQLSEASEAADKRGEPAQCALIAHDEDVVIPAK